MAMKATHVTRNVAQARGLLREAGLLLRGELERGEISDPDAVELSQVLAQVTAEAFALRRDLKAARPFVRAEDCD